MESENFNKYLCCRLCLSVTSYINSEVIEEVAREAIKVILPNLNLEERFTHRMCSICNSQLFAAFNFKSAFMGTEDLLMSHVDTNKAPVIDLKDIFLTVNSNIQLSDILENQRICRLCLQLVTYGFVSINEVDNDIIHTYMPQVNIRATQDPIICGPCFNSLRTHGGFLKNCLEAQERYQSVDKQFYNKTEEMEIKLEDGRNTQEQHKNLVDQFDIKSEEIEIKLEEGDQDNGATMVAGEMNYQYVLDCEAEDQINKFETPLNALSNGYKRNFKDDVQHKIVPKLMESSSEIQMYKCDMCSFTTKYKKNLRMHQVIHKNASEIQMYSCDQCDFETKHKRSLKSHQLTHKDSSETQMYRCDICSYETRYKKHFVHHQLTHKDPSEIQMYRCDACNFETKYKSNLRVHQLKHENPSNIQMYKCNECGHESKYKGAVKNHQLLHKDPSKIHIYKCDTCNYETRYKTHFIQHQSIHKDIS